MHSEYNSIIAAQPRERAEDTLYFLAGLGVTALLGLSYAYKHRTDAITYLKSVIRSIDTLFEQNKVPPCGIQASGDRVTVEPTAEITSSQLVRVR